MKDYGKMMIDHEAWWWQSRLTWSLLVGLHVRKVRFSKELQPLCMYTIYIYLNGIGCLLKDLLGARDVKTWWIPSTKSMAWAQLHIPWFMNKCWTNKLLILCVCVLNFVQSVRVEPHCSDELNLCFPHFFNVVESNRAAWSCSSNICFFFWMSAGKYHLRE